ncbi:MAG: type II 3-dehydroquinate dehydratase [Candidatus Pelagibacter sp.]|nr:type II 3-dehydroquinate dehydratase [Candidatus Pelagibacter sp.]OUV87370.1 MAG: type II 3-dehydroquinate dehydratase [Pelagibacteraceae bacterium TMED136]|tara:strand:- start:9994 stop:10434 length:441 start_codon:yes stop_codon:yes gene_type:complete
MSKKIEIINGPNINLLGKREPDIYGNLTLKSINKEIADYGKEIGLETSFFQSNIEGEIVNKIQISDKSEGIIINAAAFTHTSIAIHDALKSLDLPKIEVHISNIYKREEFRHKSLISNVVNGVICGLGINSYKLALKGIKNILDGN